MIEVGNLSNSANCKWTKIPAKLRYGRFLWILLYFHLFSGPVYDDFVQFVNRLIILIL